MKFRLFGLSADRPRVHILAATYGRPYTWCVSIGRISSLGSRRMGGFLLFDVIYVRFYDRCRKTIVRPLEIAILGPLG